MHIFYGIAMSVIVLITVIFSYVFLGFPRGEKSKKAPDPPFYIPMPSRFKNVHCRKALNEQIEELQELQKRIPCDITDPDIHIKKTLIAEQIGVLAETIVKHDLDS